MEAFKPGRELDALIAEKVMGCPICESPFKDGSKDVLYMNGPDGKRIVPRYSTDISAAWEVKQKTGINKIIDTGDGNVIAYYSDDKFVVGESAPHAICFAALKAVGNPAANT